NGDCARIAYRPRDQPRSRCLNQTQTAAAWTSMIAFVRGSPVKYDKFYKTARWKRLRKFQLIQHPLCKFCLQRGIVTRANVVDHVAPHKGDWTDFITGELQSLCEPCHNSAKRQIELRGYLSLRCRHCGRPGLLPRFAMVYVYRNECLRAALREDYFSRSII